LIVTFSWRLLIAREFHSAPDNGDTSHSELPTEQNRRAAPYFIDDLSFAHHQYFFPKASLISFASTGYCRASAQMRRAFRAMMPEGASKPA